MELKDGMMPINWIFISPKVSSHGLCSAPHCFSQAMYMKKYQNHYRIFCEEHAKKKSKSK